MKKTRNYIIVFVALHCFFPAANSQKNDRFLAEDYVRALKLATDVMVNDVTSPVAASRYYAYITIASTLPAGEEILVNGLLPVGRNKYPRANIDLASILAIYYVSIKMLPSGPGLRTALDSMLLKLSTQLPEEVIMQSKELAQASSVEVQRIAALDGFSRLSGQRRYTPISGDSFWQPTPPAFMSAIEPFWGILKTFKADSNSRVAVLPPVPYNADTGSTYYHLLLDVYRKGINDEQRDIALFWDCNPYALQQMGHLEFGLKKISPGGHWLGIAGIAAIKKKMNIKQTALCHAITSIAIADAFIACWTEKYRTNRVRPETAIRKLIDPGWQPILQTPPFPEYPSGHSVISMAAATVLTRIFGDNFSYHDNTEEEFGLPVRHFNSFLEAAREASISRLYGGIHYRDAIDHGMQQGTSIGKSVLANSRIALVALSKNR